MNHRPPPNDRLLRRHDEAHRHELEAVLLDGELRRLGVDGADAHHHGHARAVDVSVHQADAPAFFGERQRQIGRDRRFADAALAAGDGNYLPDSGQGEFRRNAAVMVHGRLRFW